MLLHSSVRPNPLLPFSFRLQMCNDKEFDLASNGFNNFEDRLHRLWFILRRQLQHRRRDAEQTERALWHWSLTLQAKVILVAFSPLTLQKICYRIGKTNSAPVSGDLMLSPLKVLHSWRLLVTEQRRKQEQAAQAAQVYRDQLLREGVSCILTYAAHMSDLTTTLTQYSEDQVGKSACQVHV